MEQKAEYTVVSDVAGHKTVTETVPTAAENIFKLVTKKAMECAINGEFMRFNTVDQLQTQLQQAVNTGYSINVYDENIGG